MIWRRAALFALTVLTLVGLGWSHGWAEGPDHKWPDHKWENYSKDIWGVTYYYEKDTVTFPSKGIIKLWRKRNFPMRARQKSIVSLDEIDCYEQKFHSLQMQVIKWDDSVETFNRVGEWATIYAESPEEHFLDTTCMEVRKKK